MSLDWRSCKIVGTEDQGLAVLWSNRMKCAETKTDSQLIRGQDICSKKLSARDGLTEVGGY